MLITSSQAYFTEEMPTTVFAVILPFGAFFRMEIKQDGMPYVHPAIRWSVRVC